MSVILGDLVSESELWMMPGQPQPYSPDQPSAHSDTLVSSVLTAYPSATGSRGCPTDGSFTSTGDKSKWSSSGTHQTGNLARRLWGQGDQLLPVPHHTWVPGDLWTCPLPRRTPAWVWVDVISESWFFVPVLGSSSRYSVAVLSSRWMTLGQEGFSSLASGVRI